jgi:hypothetical protein
MPRADPAQRSSKYNCRDVKVWVYRYRESSRRNKVVKYVSGVTKFAESLKRYVAVLVGDGKIEEAKGMVDQPFYPENPCGFVKYSTPHIYTQEERDDVSTFLSQLIKEK